MRRTMLKKDGHKLKISIILTAAIKETPLIFTFPWEYLCVSGESLFERELQSRHRPRSSCQRCVFLIRINS